MIYIKKLSDFNTNYNNIKELVDYINIGNKDTKLSEENFVVNDVDFVPCCFWKTCTFSKCEYIRVKLEDILLILHKCTHSVLFSLEVELKFYNITLTISKQTIQIEMKTDKLYNNSLYKELVQDTHFILSLFGNNNFRELIWTYFVGMELEKFNLEYTDNIYSYASQIIFNKMDTKGEERWCIKNAMLNLLYSKYTTPQTFEYFYKYMIMMKEGLQIQAQCKTNDE